MIVFLIDDDHDDQLFFELAISDMELPIRVYAADDGIKGLAMLDSPDFSPDFIFIDMNMPKMTGLECLTKIRELHRLKNVPVFVYSTSGDPAITKKALEHGADGVIKKQTSISAITEILRDIFEHGTSSRRDFHTC